MNRVVEEHEPFKTPTELVKRIRGASSYEDVRQRSTSARVPSSRSLKEATVWLKLTFHAAKWGQYELSHVNVVSHHCE